MHAPVGDLPRQRRVRDVDQAEVALALVVAAPARRARVGVLGGRHARVDEAALQVRAVLDLELVQAARAAAGAQQPELDRLRRVRDVEDLQAAEEARVGAIAAADLDPLDRDVAPGARAVRRGVDDDVLDRGAGRVLQLGDDARLGRVARVEHGDARLVGRRAEALLGARRVVGEAPRADVGVLLVHPHVGVEAAPADAVGADRDHVERGALRLLALRIDPLDGARLLPHVRAGGPRDDRRERGAGGRRGGHSPDSHARTILHRPRPVKP